MYTMGISLQPNENDKTYTMLFTSLRSSCDVIGRIGGQKHAQLGLGRC